MDAAIAVSCHVAMAARRHGKDRRGLERIRMAGEVETAENAAFKLKLQLFV